jgi:hypothetical protein
MEVGSVRSGSDKPSSFHRIFDVDVGLFLFLLAALRFQAVASFIKNPFVGHRSMVHNTQGGAWNKDILQPRNRYPSSATDDATSDRKPKSNSINRIAQEQ